MSTAAEDQGWKRREDDETRRLRTQSPRYCDLCESFGDHHTDRHPSDDDDEIASPEFVADLLSQSRSKLKRGK